MPCPSSQHLVPERSRIGRSIKEDKQSLGEGKERGLFCALFLPNCRFEHVCSRCYDNHRQSSCRSDKQEGESEQGQESSAKALSSQTLQSY